MGNESVGGVYIDDWWSLNGPSEVDGVSGLDDGPGFDAFRDIYTNWSLTTWEVQKATLVDGTGTISTACWIREPPRIRRCP